MKISSVAFALGLLAVIQSPTPAFAVTSTASFGVSAIVLTSCQVSAPDFTLRGSTATIVNSVSSVSVACDRPTPYFVTLSAGPSVPSSQKLIDPDSMLRTHELPITSAQAINWLHSLHLAASTITLNSNHRLQSVTYSPVAQTRFAASSRGVNSITVIVTY